MVLPSPVLSHHVLGGGVYVELEHVPFLALEHEVGNVRAPIEGHLRKQSKTVIVTREEPC